jgi:hypothetical protein
MEEIILWLSPDDIYTLLAFVSSCLASFLLFTCIKNCKLYNNRIVPNKFTKIIKSNINQELIGKYPVQPISKILYTRVISARSGDEEPIISFSI